MTAIKFRRGTALGLGLVVLGLLLCGRPEDAAAAQQLNWQQQGPLFSTALSKDRESTRRGMTAYEDLIAFRHEVKGKHPELKGGLGDKADKELEGATKALRALLKIVEEIDAEVNHLSGLSHVQEEEVKFLCNKVEEAAEQPTKIRADLFQITTEELWRSLDSNKRDSGMMRDLETHMSFQHKAIDWSNKEAGELASEDWCATYGK